MNILILYPRLDVTFKKGDVPNYRSMLSPIRQHWANFLNSLDKNLYDMGYTVEISELPLWQMDANADYSKYDVVFVPHKEKHNFDLKNTKTLYYMQTTFPDLFSIDKNGWGANLSYLPIELSKTKINYYEKYKERIINNISKFDQFAKKPLNRKDYILFLCQIPHDETIKYHSSVSVERALEMTLEFANEEKLDVIVKGHPVNPGSMEKLIEITKQFNQTYIDNYSIHNCIENCLAAFTVNSGSGLEVILHNKPLFHFGDAEYSSVSCKCKDDIYDIREKWYSWEFTNYENFFNSYINSLYDYRNDNSFIKLDNIIKEL